MNMRAAPLVCDASVVLNLGHRGYLGDLVAVLMGERDLVVTPQVMKEVTLDDPAFYRGFLDRHFRQHDRPLVAMESIPEDVRRQLDAGELSVLAVCLEEGWTACIDETLARQAARALGLNLMGTIGLLGRALERGWMSDELCLDAVKRMRGNGFYCPKIHANDDFSEYLARLR